MLSARMRGWNCPFSLRCFEKCTFSIWEVFEGTTVKVGWERIEGSESERGSDHDASSSSVLSSDKGDEALNVAAADVLVGKVAAYRL